MPITDYPFGPVIASTGVSYGLWPSLPVRIINPATGLSWQTWALVDTGASNTVVTADIAAHLGHDLKHRLVIRGNSGTAGGAAKLYFHTFTIEILARTKQGRVDEKRAVIILENRLLAVAPQSPITLLGTKDFLKDYVLTVDYPVQRFSIKKPT